MSGSKSIGEGVAELMRAAREGALREAAAMCKAFGDPQDVLRLHTEDMRRAAVYLANRIEALIGEKP
jgi:hypothetical protein